MTALSSYTGKFRTHKDPRQDSSKSKVSKKPRESLACTQCRKSKLKCDKAVPCSSCVRRNEEHNCSYDKHPAGGGLTLSAEERLIHLESMLKVLMQTQPIPPTHTQEVPEPVPTSLTGAISAVATVEDASGEQVLSSWRYAGSTHWSAVLDDIQELKIALSGSQEDHASVVFDTDDYSSRSDLIFGSPSHWTIHQIIAQYMPSRAEMDGYLSPYFQGETFIVPFLHGPLFQRQYLQFWEDQDNVNPLWLSILFSIGFMGSLIRGSFGPGTYAQEGFRKGRQEFHIAAGKCLVVGDYYRPQQWAVESTGMYAHTKNLQSLDPSREAGAILGIAIRIGYEMGYHRDPDVFGACTTFEGEMRRRSWAVCKQMDTMISFMLGLPSNICFENCDTRSPRNLKDSDFDVDTKTLPESRSESEATSLLWFIVKDRQMECFSKLCRDLLSLQVKTEEEVYALDQEVRQMNMTVPEILRTRPLFESITDSPFFIITRLYINFIYLKSLLVLHRRYMPRGNVYSTQTCIQAGTELVTQFLDIYDEFSPGGQLDGERWMLTNFTMNDFLLGIMVLCLVIYTDRKRKAECVNGLITHDVEIEILSLLERSRTICLRKSGISKDAARVAKAVQIILRDVQSRRDMVTSGISHIVDLPGLSSGSQASSDDFPTEDNFAFMSLEDNMGFGDDNVFKDLDPFYFIDNELLEPSQWRH